MGKLIKFAHVNEHADFEKVLSHLNIDYERKGSQLRLLCPFHDDTKPSLSITLTATDKAMPNSWHCFSCNTHGSIIDFVGKANGLDLRDAAIRIDEIFGCGLAPPRQTRRKTQSKKSTKGAESDSKKRNDAINGKGHDDAENAGERTSAVSDDVSDPEPSNSPLKFTLQLDTGHEYVQGRIDAGTALEFGVGVCDPDSRSMMAGRCCVPLHNLDGGLIAYAGRYLGNDPGEPKWKLPPKFNKMQMLFNAHRVRGAQHVVLVEGCFDAIRLHALSIPAVACIGTAVSSEQVSLLQTLGAKSITVLFDGDEGGQAAAEMAVPELARAFFVRLGSLPDGVDPADADRAVLVEQTRGVW